MAVDLSRPSVVPGCPPLQLKPSHFPVFQIPISLKNPSQSEVVRNWLSYPGAEAGCPSVRGARPLLPAQRPHTVGCLSSGHSRLLWVFHLVPTLSHPMSSSSSSRFLSSISCQVKELAWAQRLLSLASPPPLFQTGPAPTHSPRLPQSPSLCLHETQRRLLCSPLASRDLSTSYH